MNQRVETATAVQEQLWSCVKVGDAVYIGLIERGAGRFYMIQRMGANGRHHPNLGQLSRHVIDDIECQLKARSCSSSYTWPTPWRDLHVAAVVTEVLPPFAEGFHEPYASSRFCLGVRVRGMGCLCKE